MSIPSISFQDFYKCLEDACAIYQKHRGEFSDFHSKWIGRWIRRAERNIDKSLLASDTVKQEVTDKLVDKLFTQILVSPYDKAPFKVNAEGMRPLLFQGFLFPRWLLSDIMMTIKGNIEGLKQANEHQLLIEIMNWAESLKSKQLASASNNTQLIQVTADRALITANQSKPLVFLDSKALVSIDSAAIPEFGIIKLCAYRDLIKRWQQEMSLYWVKKGAKKQLTQITRFSDEQKDLLEKDKTQQAEQRLKHEETIKKQFAEIAEMQESTDEIMKNHLKSMLDEIAFGEQCLKKAQQECQEREAKIHNLQVAQKNLG